MYNNNETKECKYVLYARKSTEDGNKQEQSIENQLKVMKERAKELGLTIVDIEHDEKSGGHPGPGYRPGYDKMIEILRSGKANAILAWDLSRLSRNYQDNGVIHQMLEDGVIKYIVTYDRCYDASSDLEFDVCVSMNAKQRKIIMANVRRGMHFKADKGWRPCMPPIGYLNDREMKTIVKDPDNWDLVRQVFDRFLMGNITVGKLTEYAQSIGLRTHRRRKEGGSPMSYSGIKHMLKSEFYTGSYTYGGKKYNGNHPALITNEEHQKVLELIGGKHNNRPRTDYLPFVTRGMIKCAHCGYAVVAETKRKKYKNGKVQEFTYCHCSGKCKKFKCPQAKIYVREEELIKQIKETLSKYTIRQEYFDLAIEALAEEENRRFSDQKTKIDSLRKQIDRKKAALNGLRRMRYMGECPDDEFFNSESGNLENEIESLNNRINVIESAARDWRQIANDVFAFARYAKEDFDSDDLELKQYVMSTMGTNLLLSGRTLTFTPVKYLIPIEKAISKISSESESARTQHQQMKKGSNEPEISTWCWR